MGNGEQSTSLVGNGVVVIQSDCKLFNFKVPYLEDVVVCFTGGLHLKLVAGCILFWGLKLLKLFFNGILILFHYLIFKFTGNA